MSLEAPAITLQQYGVDLSAAVSRADGLTAAAILDLQDQLAVQRLYNGLPYAVVKLQNDTPHLKEFKQLFRSSQLDASGQAAWSTIASKHISAVIGVSAARESMQGTASGAWSSAFDAHLELVKTFITWFQDVNQGATAWSLPVLYTICRDLRFAAVKADEELRASGAKAIKLEEASRTITKGWTACLNDRSTSLFGGQKRSLGAYYMATLLFKTYFKLETLGLCKNIVRGIQNQTDLPPLSTFPRSHQVTYRYYLGIFAFLNEKYQDAERELEFAFRACHKRAYGNQERILGYLLPVKLLRGILPSSALLNNYPKLKHLYGPFIEAYRKGDLKAYDDALLRARGALISRSSFLIIEKAREGCLRTLFKRVWLCSDKGSRLLVSTVQQALSHVSVEVDSDEVECLLANLIFKGHLRGYISHERQTVVLAKDRPFPDIIGKSLAV